MARRSLFIVAGCVVALILVSETIAQNQNSSTENHPSSAGSNLTEGESWFRSGLRTFLQYAGGRLIPMRTAAGVRFNLYTRRGKEHLELSPSSLGASGFNNSNPTTVLVHGWNTNVVDPIPWMEQTTKALLKRGPWNVIVVDWTRLVTVFYPSTVVRARSIPGPVAAELLRMLQDVKGLDLSTVHVVGFSLGAHVAGFIGQNIQGIGRITGLDPAGPLFRSAEPSMRLSPDDALFVDVVNTNVGSFLTGLSLGINPEVDVGHVSVNFNGGEHQPGCGVGTSCSHYRAPIYFIESLQLADDFMVYPCETSNKTLPVPFGLHMPHTARGCYFAGANRDEPFLQTPSPLLFRNPTTESNLISNDATSDATSINQTVGDKFHQLEQGFMGQVSPVNVEWKSLLERKQVHEPEQILKPEQQLLKPVKVLEPEHISEPDQFLKPKQLLKSELVLQPKELSEVEKVSEEEQISEKRFSNLRKRWQSMQTVAPNQVPERNHFLEPSKSSKPQQQVESQKPKPSSLLMPSMDEVTPIKSMPSQIPAYFNNPVMKSHESQNSPPTWSQPLPKPVQMPQVLSPQKPSESSESVMRKETAEGLTVSTSPRTPSLFEIVFPELFRSQPVKPVEN